METTIKVTALSHDELVDILSTALYGCDYLGADYDRKVYKALVEKGVTEGDCFEDKLADMLLNGEKITIIDYYAEGEVYKNGVLEDEDGVYELTLADFLEACSSEEGYEYAKTLLIDEDGDYFTANNLLQIIMFGEVIYG